MEWKFRITRYLLRRKNIDFFTTPSNHQLWSESNVLFLLVFAFRDVQTHDLRNKVVGTFLPCGNMKCCAEGSSIQAAHCFRSADAKLEYTKANQKIGRFSGACFGNRDWGTNVAIQTAIFVWLSFTQRQAVDTNDTSKQNKFKKRQ